MPHRISYDKHGLYVESYGNAMFVKNDMMQGTTTYSSAVSKSKSFVFENSYKYLVHNVGDTMFSSVHFPKCGNRNIEKWFEYTTRDIHSILSNVDIIGFIIGDFNINVSEVKEILDKFPDFDFTIENKIPSGVDFIVKVIRNQINQRNQRK